MLLKACLNGARHPREHPALPVTPNELAQDAARVRAAGADAVHLHVKDDGGEDTLDGDALAAVLAAVRSSVPGLPIGVTTGAWAEVDSSRRVGAVSDWTSLPDFASVNWHEEGAEQVASVLLERGVEVEAGLWHADAVRAWLARRSGSGACGCCSSCRTARTSGGPKRRQIGCWTCCAAVGGLPCRCSCTARAPVAGPRCGTHATSGWPHASGWRTSWSCRTARQPLTTQRWWLLRSCSHSGSRTTVGPVSGSRSVWDACSRPDAEPGKGLQDHAPASWSGRSSRTTEYQRPSKSRRPTMRNPCCA